MTKSLNASPSIRIYKEYVNTVGLGWNVESSGNLRFPETTAVLQPLQYASLDEKAR